MPITRENILHIAKLAHLRLEPDEVVALQADLASILEHIEKLGELDTSGIQPTAHLVVDAAPMRIDTVVPGLSNESALAEAPRPREGGFAVPAFVDES
jgi:aspartyl-tRNA(Asn)/glutamyl-tRNA(Gln) amidotransferase subunit C